MASREWKDAIIEVLRGGRMTTLEVEAAMSHRPERCPDDLARTLNQMRRQGEIHGCVSLDKGGWVWWADQERAE